MYLGKVQRLLEVNVVENHDMYLGLPTVSCRNKRLQFGFLRDRAIKRLSSWKNKLLSAGGKEILIKSVIQAIPTYAMQCFRIPVSICGDIERACAQFWWGSNAKTRCKHWIAWNDLCRPKERGGLGFRNLCSFNKALLAKQVWRVMQNPTSLVARVLKAKYFKHSTLLDAKVRSNASFIWRSLCWARPILHYGLRWKIGDGNTVSIFRDRFMEDISGEALSYRETQNIHRKVAEFLTICKDWDMEKLELEFGIFWAGIISQIPIMKEGGDKFCWGLGPSKCYSVKYGYLAASGYFDSPEMTTAVNPMEWSKAVWSRNMPPKIKIFLWRLLTNTVAVPVNLVNNHVPGDGICEGCRKAWGTSLHVLYFCDNVEHIWKGGKFWTMLKENKNKSIWDLAREIRRCWSLEEYELWATTSYFTWRWVCNKKHGEGKLIDKVSLSNSQLYLEAFRMARKSLHADKSLGVKVGERRWHAPPKGVFRVDVDAAVDWNNQLFGVGVVIRDWKGDIRAALALPMGKPSTVHDAEMCAVLYGVGLCFQEGCGPVDLFSDSLSVVRYLCKAIDTGEIEEEDTQALVQANSDGVIRGFYHMFRSANFVAHSLARFGARSDKMYSWNSNFPPFVRALINE